MQTILKCGRDVKMHSPFTNGLLPCTMRPPRNGVRIRAGRDEAQDRG